LLRLPVKIFNDPLLGQEILRTWQRKFDFIIVDEYQDTNHAQNELLKLLARDHRNICVVGDDDQSIYGWRAADVGLIRQFPQEWQGAKVVKLQVNYRSTQPILDLGNRLMTHEEGRHEKTLISARPPGAAPVVVVHENEFEEAKWIASTIGQSGQPYGSNAILVRSQFKLEPIRNALEEAKIPYVEWRSDRFRLGEVKRNVYALLAAIHDPEKEEPAFIQLLEGSVFSLPAGDYEALMSHRDEGTRSLWKLLNSDFVQRLSGETREKVGQFTKLVDDLHGQVARVPREARLAELALKGIRALYPQDTSEQEWQSKKPKSEATVPLRNICKFIDSYESRTKRPSLNGYLGHLERIKRKTHGPASQDDESTENSAVIISTIHGAKGLEFTNVFMPGLNEGILPSSQSLKSNNDTQLAEERRLFYVALTRAKDGLFLSWPDERSYRGALRPQQASRYLFESGAYGMAVSGTPEWSPRPEEPELDLFS
jgi:DNA helicase-2/ATP-dependent DNA helicase PcrA